MLAMAVDQDVTGRLIHCAIRVHRTLGVGFVEKIYQRTMGVELKRNDLRYDVERKVDVYYEGVNVGTTRLF